MTELQAAWESRAWYPLAGIIVTFILAAWKKLSPLMFAKIPPRYQWIPAVAVATLGAFLAAYQTGDAWFVAVFNGISAGLAAIGAHHTAKRIAGQVSE